jgi:hypothetical protein
MAEKFQSAFVKFAKKTYQKMAPMEVRSFPIGVYDTAPLIGMEGAIYLIKLAARPRGKLIRFGSQDWRNGNPLKAAYEPRLRNTDLGLLLDVVTYAMPPMTPRVDAYRLRSFDGILCQFFTRKPLPRGSGKWRQPFAIFFDSEPKKIVVNQQLVLGYLADPRTVTREPIMEQVAKLPFARVYFVEVCSAARAKEVLDH